MAHLMIQVFNLITRFLLQLSMKCALIAASCHLSFKEEEEAAKTETEEKKIIDPSGDVEPLNGTKEIIEYELIFPHFLCHEYQTKTICIRT